MNEEFELKNGIPVGTKVNEVRRTTFGEYFINSTGNIEKVNSVTVASVAPVPIVHPDNVYGKVNLKTLAHSRKPQGFKLAKEFFREPLTGEKFLSTSGFFVDYKPGITRVSTSDHRRICYVKDVPKILNILVVNPPEQVAGLDNAYLVFYDVNGKRYEIKCDVSWT